MAKRASPFDRFEDYLQRILRLFSLLVDMHLELALREASYERQRLIGGLVMLSIGVGLMSMGLVLLQVAAILAMHYLLGLSWLWSTVNIAVINFFLGSLFFLAANRRLQQPFMVQTQARLAKSTAILRQHNLDRER